VVKYRAQVPLKKRFNDMNMTAIFIVISMSPVCVALFVVTPTLTIIINNSVA